MVLIWISLLGWTRSEATEAAPVCRDYSSSTLPQAHHRNLPSDYTMIGAFSTVTSVYWTFIWTILPKNPPSLKTGKKFEHMSWDCLFFIGRGRVFGGVDIRGRGQDDSRGRLGGDLRTGRPPYGEEEGGGGQQWCPQDSTSWEEMSSRGNCWYLWSLAIWSHVKTRRKPYGLMAFAIFG